MSVVKQYVDYRGRSIVKLRKSIRICGDEHMGVRLGNICRFQSGGTPSKGKPEFFNGTIPWITTTALNGGNVGKESAVDWISEQAIKESAAKIVPAFSIMVGTRVGVGKVAINTTSMSTSQDIVSLLDIDENVWSKAFLCKFLQAKGTFLNSQARGATIKGIKIDVLSELELPEIPMEEQQHISQIIDKIKAIIVIRQQQLQKLDELVKARFVEMFGDVIRNSKSWEIRVLADIASSRLGKMLDTKQQTGECSYPYLANFNVQWFRFNTENLNQMDFNEEDRIEFELQNGDLLVCEGGEIGRCAVWHNEIQPCFFQKALHRVRCNRQIVHPDYLGWWFKYNCDHDGFATIAGAKATIAHLPGVKLKQLRVAIPPLELQEQFAAFVNQTDKSKAVVQKALDEAQLLFDSLMQKYLG